MRSDVPAFICALSVRAGLALLLAGCATHSMSRAEKRANENEARSAALHWLQLLDDGDYEEAFEFEAQDFRMSRTQSQFVRLMQARRAPFGNCALAKIYRHGPPAKIRGRAGSQLRK